MLPRIRMLAAAVLGLIGSAGMAAEPAAPASKAAGSDIVQVGWDGPPAPAGCAGGAAPAGRGGLLGGLTIGEGCRSTPGCSSFASERTFLWGGCNQFFNAGYKCKLCGRNRGASPVGAGGLGDHCPCVYGSYHNR